jgi:pyruvate dehydrogenase E2 component (dihydrolipoamide acetyltransferase)
VRKIARDLGIDLARVRGSEAGGRIALADLRSYVERLQQIAFSGAPGGQPALMPATAPAQPSELPEFSKWGPVHREKMSALRRTVSRRMVESWTAIPKIDQLCDMDITELLALRKKHSADYEKEGARLTVTTFIVKAVAGALKKHPKANSSMDAATDELIFKDYFHIGVAVDTEAGLIVPVIRDADKKSLLEIARDVAALSEKSRQRKISLEDFQSGQRWRQPFYTDHLCAAGGDLGRGSERGKTGRDRRQDRYTQHPAALSFLRSPGARRRRRSALLKRHP